MNIIHRIFMLLLTFMMGHSVLAGDKHIDKTLYFDASIRDAEYCSMQFSKEHQQLIAVNNSNGKLISNPAMTCPDMFSWKLFAEVVDDQFWSHWADERQNWPKVPYAVCKTGQQPEKDSCCEFGNNNNSKEHCPIYPGRDYAHLLSKGSKFKLGSPQLIRATRTSFHGQFSSSKALGKSLANSTDDLNSENTVPSCAAVEIDGKTTNVTSQIYENFIPKNPTPESIGRVIRQTNAELTVRNQVFHDYLFQNNLYNTSGLLDAFNASNQNLAENAPYHMRNQSTTNTTPGKLYRIDLPPEAIMIKSNWLNKELAHRLGLSTDDSQYVHSNQMSTDIDLNALGITKAEPSKCNLKGTHYLVAFHISSKDIPNWVWTTFEHINLPGRCDITGCNDSYGYKSADKHPAGTADNYVVANQQSDHLNSPTEVFHNDAGYKKEAIRDEWNNLLTDLNIGVTEQQKNHPMSTDKAWRNYRLKGSQVEFVNAKGIPTILGNSVTEAGFMDGSSCISCHSRAAIASGEEQSSMTFPLSVFQRDLTDFGYARSVHGTPNPSWFYNDDNNAPQIEAMQTDFIWGFLFAKAPCGGDTGKQCSKND